MSEPEEASSSFPPKSKDLNFMDLDLDPVSSWPFDHFSLASDPMSPFHFSSTEQPCSPLWAFSDGYDEKLLGNAYSTLSGGLRLSDYPRFLTLNADPANEPPKESDDKRRYPSIQIGLTPPEPDFSCLIKERMTQALRYFKESTEQHVLAQVWAPVKNGGRFVLTTSGQPFVLDPHSNGLNQYRMVSLTYMFSVDEKSDGDQGLPGRVFQHKLPEWTPNVQYYSSREFSRLDHALHYNVRGTLALPVFEPSGQSCVGVVELILTSQKINYAPEVDKVCKALEAVNLKSSEILEHPKTQICNEGRHNALAEILEILTVVCETHKLPLAQTWVPCRHRNVLAYGGGLKKSCSSFDGSCMGQVCMSTSDVAFYIVDAHIWGFREACAEHHLQAGQGVAGRAFSSHNSCFYSDITQFSKTEYPLVHYARLFGLTSCYAVCLRSTHTGNDDYILEFFLPPDVRDTEKQQTLLDTILDTMKQHFQTLKIASKKELEDERCIDIIKASISIDEKLDTKLEYDILPNGGEPQIMAVSTLKSGRKGLGASGSKKSAPCTENKRAKKPSTKKRGKAEKSISLVVLQQYFAGSLKDAAKSLGVCPTTMKRICRQHGISRWPSRKIIKVNRSLSKLKSVIESVQGGEEAFGLNSLATSPLPNGSISWANWNGSNYPNSPSGYKPFENATSPNNCKSPENDKNTPGDGGCISSKSKTRSASREEENAASSDSRILSSRECLIGKINSTQTTNQPSLELNVLIPQEPFGAMLVEDAGSSKDLQNLCPSPIDAVIHTATTQNFPIRQEMMMATIKATYKEDIIRFKIPFNSGIVELREEVSKRLKLEVGSFDIKYLDDDHEWVLIACDADFQECMDISRSPDINVIRLSIHDIMGNPGSSCESTGGL